MVSKIWGFTRAWYFRYPCLIILILLSLYGVTIVYSSRYSPSSAFTNPPQVAQVQPSPPVSKAAPPSAPKQQNQTPVLPGPCAKVVWSIPVTQRVVFITIDDGWFPNQEVLSLMQKYNLPVSAFLIERAAAEHTAYWREFVKDGGTIEDHTLSHPSLTNISPSEDISQIADPIQYFKQFGPAPVLLRPPYGNYNQTVEQAAYSAGIKYIVMWGAIMENGRLSTYNHKPLAPGEIILMHWVPGMDKDMVKLLQILAEENLGVADLNDALSGRPLRIYWPQKQAPGTVTKTVYSSVSNSVDSSVYSQPKK